MKEYSKERIIDDQHWRFADYSQRITRNDWKAILLNNDDKIIYRGRVHKLVGKNIGSGVVEVTKVPLG